jgi:hypothetical protein
LWVAARTDPELREALREIETGFTARIFVLCRGAVGSELSSRSDFDDRLMLAANTMRGLALLRFSRLEEPALERQWAYAREHLIGLFQ